MAWKYRGSRVYFYHSYRDGHAVRTEYYGRGKIAEELAESLRQRRAERSAHARELAEFKDLVRELEKLDRDLAYNVGLLTQAVLLGRGWYYYHRQWRRRGKNVRSR